MFASNPKSNDQASFANTIDFSKLEPGDLIFIKRPTGFNAHICAIMPSKTNGIYNRFHAVFGKHLLVEPMVTIEQLAKAPCDAGQVFRIRDKEARKNFIAILEEWVKWGVPFDSKRHKALTDKTSELLQSEWAGYKQLWPVMHNMNPDLITDAINFNKSTFKIEDAIKYAARRNISPSKPKENHTEERGFHCMSVMMAALQAAYIVDDVPAISDKWCSNKHGLFSNPVVESSRIKGQSEDEFKSMLIQRIPEELRLNIKLCAPEIFIHSIVDGQALEQLGKLIPPTDDELLADDKLQNEANIALIQEGMRKRDEFRQSYMRKI